MRRLIIRPGAIGDCVLSLPALEHLRAAYTEIWISTPVVPLIDFADAVCSIASTGIELLGVGDLEPPPELLSRLRSFDSIVSWYGANRPEFRQALGVKSTFHAALPPSEFEGHATDFFCEQVGAPLASAPRIRVLKTERRNAVVIHPFSGSPRKNWPLAAFRKLAQRLSVPVEWSAGPDEALDEAQRFSSLRDLAEWIAGARLYIGNDSGITHLAAATGVPVIAIFGPTSPALWAPRGTQVTIVCREPIGDIDTEAVLDAANQLLGLP